MAKQQKKKAEKKEVKKPVAKRGVKKVENIYKKIFNVQSEIGTVLMGGENTHHRFKYAREKDVINEIKPLLRKEGLLVLATTKHVDTEDKKRRVKMKFTLVNVENPDEKISEIFHGEGENKEGSVVGLPVAYTMALKYFLSKTFMIETGDDAEKEGKKGAKTPANESPEVKFKKAKDMINKTNNIPGLIEYEEKLNDSKTFTKGQKTELSDLIKKRVDHLESKGD